MFYSEFDNQDDVLTWQNPYSSYGPNVRYPAGIGGLGLAPDNDQVGGRMTGQYVFAPTIRLQVDGSYAVASQNQDFLDYSVNPALVVNVPVPRNDYGGDVDSSTLNTKLLLNPLPKLSARAVLQVPRPGLRCRARRLPVHSRRWWQPAGQLLPRCTTPITTIPPRFPASRSVTACHCAAG